MKIEEKSYVSKPMPKFQKENYKQGMQLDNLRHMHVDRHGYPCHLKNNDLRRFKQFTFILGNIVHPFKYITLHCPKNTFSFFPRFYKSVEHQGIKNPKLSKLPLGSDWMYGT